ncbi:hypothetical protein J132_09970 [Termitomyces sp. J132]|nr:hypothetical protein J132_09970 [Termitomyces sp. J132]
MKIGPLWGGWREEAPTMHNKGKWRVSPLPEAGPSKRAWGEPAMVGPPSPIVYFPTSGALVEQSVGGSWLIAKAILQHQAEELERLLATCGEEVCRVEEKRDGFWRKLDKARRELDKARRELDKARRKLDKAQRELDKAQKEQDLACRDKDIAVGTATEQLLQLQELQVHMRPLEAQVEAVGQ